MNLLVNWMSAPVISALAATLAHFVWEGTAIALALAIAMRCAGRKAAARYALACLAMVAMVVAFGLTLVWFWPVDTGSSPVAANFPRAARVIPGPGAMTAVAASLAERIAWVVPLWMAGVVVFYLYGLGGWLVAWRLRQRGVTPAPAEWQERLHHLSRTLRVSRPVALMESCLAGVPMVIGFVRPVILLPLGLLTGLSMDQVEAILIHELAHVRRGDYLINALQKVVEGLLFYHPAVWWVSSLIRAERENCCDDAVVRLQGDAYGYASTLARLEEIRWPARQPALAATGGDLMRRVRRLLHQPEGPRGGAAPAIASAILLGAAALLSAWQPAPAPVPAPKPAPQPPAVVEAAPESVPEPQQTASPAQASELDAPYRLWLNEDVAYIITDEERAAFQRLTTREEREHFIEQFWLRRDPTPGTPENEFKEEHYRRIAYANQQFSNANVAGWKTDRGRIYVTFGPPDEKENHPAGGWFQRPGESSGVNIASPYEAWLYRYIEGIGKNVVVLFVDTTGSGEYRLVVDPSEKGVALNLPRAMKSAGQPGSSEWQFVEVLGRIATVRVPLYVAGEERPLKVSGRITTSDGRLVTAFEQGGLQGQDYSRSVTLAPGSYLVETTISGKNGRFLTVGPKAFTIGSNILDRK